MTARFAHGVRPRRCVAVRVGAPNLAGPGANPYVAALSLALTHHPVIDRNGRIVTSAITSLDLHDIARSSRTYGVSAFFVVHPAADQREFAGRGVDHWMT